MLYLANRTTPNAIDYYEVKSQQCEEVQVFNQKQVSMKSQSAVVQEKSWGNEAILQAKTKSRSTKNINKIKVKYPTRILRH